MDDVPLLEVRDLEKTYEDGYRAVRGVSYKIKPGVLVGLIGPNGCGKSTLLRLLLGFEKPQKGAVYYDGRDLERIDLRSLRRRIGVVMQNVAVVDELTVYENIDYFCGLYVKDKALRKQYVDEAIAFVGLDDFRKFFPKKLSGGLLRRLNIACGIAHKPKLIIMDEPTVAVDPQSRNKILEGIEELNRNGATIIYTSHYMEEVEQICSRIAIMDKGKNLAIGTKDELKQMIKKSESISIDILDLPDAAIDEIRALKHVYEVTYENHMLTVLCSGGSHNLIHVLDYLQQHEITFGKVYSELPTLNDVFLEITGKELRD